MHKNKMNINSNPLNSMTTDSAGVISRRLAENETLADLGITNRRYTVSNFSKHLVRQHSSNLKLVSFRTVAAIAELW